MSRAFLPALLLPCALSLSAAELPERFTLPAAEPAPAGAALLHDYGGFRLYGLPAAGSARAAVTKGGNPRKNTLELGPEPVDTVRGMDHIPNHLKAPTGDGFRLELIQFVGPVTGEWLTEVEATGARLVQFVANDGYLVWADARARAKLHKLAQGGHHLRFADALHPFSKLSPKIYPRLATPPAGKGRPDRAAAKAGAETVEVQIQLFRHEGSAETLALIRQLAVGRVQGPDPVLGYDNLRVTVPADALLEIVQRPDVTALDLAPNFKRLDESQAQIVAGHFSGSPAVPTGPGYKAFLEGLGFSTDPNDYPLLDITDDGLGNGSPLNGAGDPTLTVQGDGATSRIAYVQNCTGAPIGSSDDGHGHINTSIAVGYDTRSGAPYRDAQGLQLGLGMNPFGRAGSTKIFTTTFDISHCSDMTGVIAAAAGAGARISSNSWGASTNSYTSDSQAYDAATRDALSQSPGLQEVTYFFSAGNDGESGTGTIGSPATAKNVITVGASEGVRNGWTDGCFVGPDGADNAMDIASFSSRGPAVGNRAKPELVAPGSHIQGTASTSPGYGGGGVCDQYKPDAQTVFAASSGTSHSTPAVAGVGTLVWHWLERHYGVTPSPALMKAYLIAHPTYLTGTDANDALPGQGQGYGMPNLEQLFDSTERVIVNQTEVFGAAGQMRSAGFKVLDPSKPVRIVLAYTDAPAVVNSSAPLVNDLSLTAYVGSDTYRGNQFTGQWSTAGAATVDHANNYEAIFLPPGSAGYVTVQVSADAIGGDGLPGNADTTDQDYALVCYNCVPANEFTVTPPAQTLCGVTSAGLDVSVSGDPAGDITLGTGTLPAGATASFSFNPVWAGQISRLTLDSLTTGSHTVQVTANNGNGLLMAAETRIDIAATMPGYAALLSPASGAAGLSLLPTFTWAATADARDYTLEIATDPFFNTVVQRKTGLTGTSYTPSLALAGNTRYYWRLRVANACGEVVSAPQSFTTANPTGCAGGEVSLWREDFEAGLGNWDTSGSNTSGRTTWAASSARAHGGSQSALAVDHNIVTEQRLAGTTDLALPAGAELFLHFWDYERIEDQNSGGCWDGGILEISTDAGASWSQVSDAQLGEGAYRGAIASENNPLDGLRAWCGADTSWRRHVAALSEYAGQNARFRFRLGTDEMVGKEGWYLDDLEVVQCTSGAEVRVTPPAGLETSIQGDSASFQVVLSQQPLADVSIDLALSDNTVATLSTSRVTFTPSDWSTPQTVTVTGRNPGNASSDVTYLVTTAAAASSDPAFSGKDPVDVVLVNRYCGGVGPTSVSCPAGHMVMLETDNSTIHITGFAHLTARVTGRAPTGEVTFFENGTEMASCRAVPLTTSGDQATATCSFMGIVVGDYAITAAYSGDSNNPPAVSQSLVQHVIPGTALVMLDRLAQTYDGYPHPVDCISAPPAMHSVTYNGSMSVPVNAGSYTVECSVISATMVGSATGTLVIAKADPVIDWSAPAGITYGTPLSATQLNATSAVAGAFVYTPTVGSVPGAGTRTLTAQFTPTDAANYNSVDATVPLTVAKAQPTLRFGAIPGAITGQPVTIGWVFDRADGGSGLPPAGPVTVTASRAGQANVSCSASPSAGGCSLTFEAAGSWQLAAVFADEANYSAASAAPATVEVTGPAAVPLLTPLALAGVGLLLAGAGFRTSRRRAGEGAGRSGQAREVSVSEDDNR